MDNSITIQGVEPGDKLNFYIQAWNKKGEIQHIDVKFYSLDLYKFLKDKYPSALSGEENVWLIKMRLENEQLKKSNWEGECNLCGKDLSKCSPRKVIFPGEISWQIICGTCEDAAHNKFFNKKI